MLVRVLLLWLACGSVFAQAFPAKPVRIVVGYPPGGSGDFTTRLVADEMAKDLGVAVIADNRPGAGGNIAAEIVAKAPADGYTLVNAWHHAINIALYKSTNYQEKEFAAVCRVATGATVLVVNNNQPFNNLRELIDYARQNPGKLFNASAGFGSAPHLAAVLFERLAGVDMVHVPYKGGAPAVQSVLAGDTQLSFATPPSVLPLVQAGRLRALAVTSRAATPLVPGGPGMAEAGLPDYEISFWYGFFVPAGTPPEVVRKLFSATSQALKLPEIARMLARDGTEIAGSASPEDYAAFLVTDAKLWERIVKEGNVKAD